MAAKKAEPATIEVCGQELRVSNPGKLFFPERKLTKLDLVNYYVECEEAVVRGLRDRPTVMKRWVDGVEGKPFFQKRVPDSAPEWLQTATVTFPSGRHARELVPNDAAHLVWGVNLGVIDWNPWPVRRADLDHPDELRVDLDPQPDVPFSQVREVALCVREVLDEHGLRGFPKTSGSRGIHVYVRVDARARLPAGAHARRSRSRARSSGACPGARRAAGGRRNARACSSTTTRTRATARSPRRTPCARCADARVSCAAGVGRGRRRRAGRADAADGARRACASAATRRRRSTSTPARWTRCSSSPRATSAKGLGDAPWPPHFAKQKGEPKRVQPSRARKPKEQDA